MYRVGIALAALATAATLQAAPANATAPASTQASTAASPATRACFDGRCKIKVTRAVSFRVSSRYGITKVSIARLSGGMVRVRGYGGGASLEVQFGINGTGQLNNILITPLSITRHSATLRFSPM